MTVRVEAAGEAGQARIVVPGGAGAVAAPGFRLQREEDWGDDKLGPQGWQTTEAVLLPDRAERSGADLVLHLGWSVCQHVEAGMYSLWVPGAGVADAAISWPDIAPVHAGALPAIAPAIVPAIAPAIVPAGAGAVPPASPAVAPAPPPVVPKPPAPVPPTPRGSIWLLVLLGLLVLLAAGGGYWWLRGRPVPPVTEAVVPPPAPPQPETPSAPPAPAPPAPAPPLPAPPAPPPPVNLGRLAVPEVLAQAPDAAAIAAEGARRLAGDRRDDGVLLLESAADRGDPAAAAALARLYDPVLFQPGGPIPRPDPRQAARHYRDAARAGADVAAAREALRQDLERRSQAGDLGAGLSLKDFWP